MLYCLFVQLTGQSGAESADRDRGEELKWRKRYELERQKVFDVFVVWLDVTSHDGLCLHFL